jgi:hypothetical protein
MMKRTLIAAATLLLSTSALSAAATAQGDKPGAVNDPNDPVIAAKYAQAAAMKGAMGGPFEAADSDKPDAVNDPTDPVIAAKYAQAAAMKSGQASTGVGGPLEEANSGTASLTPRPAQTNYPPCDPGPGDDSCIQLYEPGVRAQLAAWNSTTGGLADGAVTTAMGGPYEPLDESVENYELAMNGDGVVDTAHGEKVDGDAEDVQLAQHSQFSGVGGPIEAQSGYPPCSATVTDSCIQLYERGVTGSGN